MINKEPQSKKLHILMLASGVDTHTVRWVNALSEKGLKISLASLHGYSKTISSRVNQIQLIQKLPFGYFTARYELTKFIENERVDIVHAHYATGYGSLGRLLNAERYVLSVWGSDVLIFPGKSFLHRWLVQKNIRAADVVCSTSKIMGEVVENLVPGKKCLITPFGIDTRKFYPIEESRHNDKLIIGTVKKLTPIYGVDRLIRAFCECIRSLNAEGSEFSSNLELLIVGDGPERKKLEYLVSSLGIESYVSFNGAVPHSDVCRVLQSFDIYVAASRSESFGVAVLEASSCAVPVVVTNVGGLPEVVQHKKTGVLVTNDESNVVNDLAENLIFLIKKKMYREELGLAGRKFVQSTYEWSDSVSQMQEIYAGVMKQTTLD